MKAANNSDTSFLTETAYGEFFNLKKKCIFNTASLRSSHWTPQTDLLSARPVLEADNAAGSGTATEPRSEALRRGTAPALQGKDRDEENETDVVLAACSGMTGRDILAGGSRASEASGQEGRGQS